MKSILIVLSAGVALAACDPIDTSALEEIEQTAANARQTVEIVNARGAQVQQAVEDPLGALAAAAGTRLIRTPTDQPGVYLLTDAATGCQFLATYAADGTTVASIAPRTNADGRQVCVNPTSLGGETAEAEG